MFIIIFVTLSLAYYISRLFQPNFYSEMVLEVILKRNKECKSLEDLRIKAITTDNMKDVSKLLAIILFCTLHMWFELLAVIILVLGYKSKIATIYLVFWILIYIKRRVDSRKFKSEKNELDRMRSSLRECYKPSERLITLADTIFFMCVYINIILGGI